MRYLFSLVMLLAVAVFVLVAEHVPASAGAQEQDRLVATTREPVECTVAPRSIAEVRALLPTPVPPPDQTATPAPSTYRHVPASPEVVAGIAATARDLVACVNAGDVLRVLALYTDRLLTSGSLTSGDINPDAPPASVTPEDRVALLGVVSVWQFDDSHAGAVILTDDPRIPSPVDPSFFFFAKAGGRWLIGEYPAIFAVSYEASPAEGSFDMGTPASQPNQGGCLIPSAIPDEQPHRHRASLDKPEGLQRSRHAK